MDHKVLPPQYQIFINFRGDELRNNFISHLVDALRRNGINIFTDKEEQKGQEISNLFKRIEESMIALAVFSKRYAESRWCLDEIAKIKECVDLGKLTVLPIFYNVTAYDVKQLEGEFGVHFRHREREYRHEQPKIDRWKRALESVSGKIGLTYNDKSLSENNFIGTIVKDVLILLENISKVQNGNVVKPHQANVKFHELPTQNQLAMNGLTHVPVQDSHDPIHVAHPIVAPANALKHVVPQVHRHGSGLNGNRPRHNGMPTKHGNYDHDDIDYGYNDYEHDDIDYGYDDYDSGYGYGPRPTSFPSKLGGNHIKGETSSKTNNAKRPLKSSK